MQNKLSRKQQQWCNDPYSVEEIEVALAQRHPLKAPRPYGLPALFYQIYWHIVGQDVITWVLGELNNQHNMEAFNRTFIVLIPKCKNPRSLKDFRPISLCSVVMKLITKTIANRLKQILSSIIDEDQIVFVKGRLITNNALRAMDCFH